MWQVLCLKLCNYEVSLIFTSLHKQKNGTNADGTLLKSQISIEMTQAQSFTRLILTFPLTDFTKVSVSHRTALTDISN